MNLRAFFPLFLFLLIVSGTLNAYSQPGENSINLGNNSDSVSIVGTSVMQNQSGAYLQPFHRFLYTSFVMFSSSLAGHLYLYIRTTDQDWGSKISWKHIEQSFTMWPQKEEDHWTFNYMVHPYMGSLTYLASRNRGGRILPSLGLSALNSAMYEYFVASSIQRPSINDMIITPLGGMLLGEGIFFLKNKLLKDRFLTFTEKVLLLAIDPYECLRHGFRFSRMLIQNEH